ncbi:MAG: NAD(P)/FAD-dependent oxidoreductase [Planctomycetota bacterium]|nr:NAD(P)/FAD-dependent oxidoreductase [Planctomycetota bacterium]
MPRPRVVIIGAGFAGLAAARALRRAPVAVTIIDRQNHHVFQPLLYQVASAALSPAQIAAPVRAILGAQRNTEIVMGEVVGIDLALRGVCLGSGEVLGYETLIIAAGATHSYFGRDDWAAFAPGLKTIDDALAIRARLLRAFEAAERETDPERVRALLTFVVVGAGPTGVEMSGAIAEIARSIIRADYRRIDTSRARVVLIEAQARVLPSGFPDVLCARAARDLRDMGVEVRTGERVTAIDARGVEVGGVRIESCNVIWAAGVRASPLGALLGTDLDANGRVKVGADLALPGHPEVFVIGDLAHVPDGARGGLVPGVAPAAMQMGRYVGGVVARESRRGGAPGPRPAFRYRDKGTLATIGRARAVARVAGMNLTGFVAWAFWALLHVFFLIGFRNRVMVMFDWVWEYVFFERGARLITGDGGRSEAAPPT